MSIPPGAILWGGVTLSWKGVPIVWSRAPLKSKAFTLSVADSQSEGDPLQIGYIESQVLTSNSAGITSRHHLTEVLTTGLTGIRSSFINVQTLELVPPLARIKQDRLPPDSHDDSGGGAGGGTGSTTYRRIEPGFIMSTVVFPTLRGLGYDVIKRPRFSTKVSLAAGGQETRTPAYEFPKWEFELNFEFLSDRGAGNTDLKTLQAFILARRGSYDSFLFKDPDDYVVIDGVIGMGDGTSTAWTLVRTLGLAEPIGQVEFIDTLTINSSSVGIIADTVNYITIPATLYNSYVNGDGPVYLRVEAGNTLPTPLRQDEAYWIHKPTRGDNDPYRIQLSASKADALANRYMPLLSTGSGSFTLYQSNIIVKVDGDVADPSTYHLVQPNQLVFYDAPLNGAVITASFHFYYICRFLEDTTDFNKMMDSLWELQKCTFTSIPSAL
jgi:hypothetical protein